MRKPLAKTKWYNIRRWYPKMVGLYETKVQSALIIGSIAYRYRFRYWNGTTWFLVNHVTMRKTNMKSHIFSSDNKGNCYFRGLKEKHES